MGDNLQSTDEVSSKDQSHNGKSELSPYITHAWSKWASRMKKLYRCPSTKRNWKKMKKHVCLFCMDICLAWVTSYNGCYLRPSKLAGGGQPWRHAVPKRWPRNGWLSHIYIFKHAHLNVWNITVRSNLESFQGWIICKFFAGQVLLQTPNKTEGRGFSRICNHYIKRDSVHLISNMLECPIIS